MEDKKSTSNLSITPEQLKDIKYCQNVFSSIADSIFNVVDESSVINETQLGFRLCGIHVRLKEMETFTANLFKEIENNKTK